MGEQNNRQIDLSFLQSFTGGDKEKMAKYITMFIKSTPVQLETMKTQCRQKEWIALRTTAHSLKPQAGYMGAAELKEIFLRIETYAGEGVNLDAVPGLIEKAEQLSKETLAELQRIVNELSA